MSRTAFTPGPWTIERDEVGEGFYGRYHLIGDDAQEIASVHGDPALANARLMAAAPDLADEANRIVSLLIIRQDIRKRLGRDYLHDDMVAREWMTALERIADRLAALLTRIDAAVAS